MSASSFEDTLQPALLQRAPLQQHDAKTAPLLHESLAYGVGANSSLQSTSATQRVSRGPSHHISQCMGVESSLRSSSNSSRTQMSLTPNNTGLPDQLKSGIEQLSGYSLDDVRVYRHSSKPAQLQADAFAQGTDIHLASGQEAHLPHEAWHVVQQKQGRVKPTMQLMSTPLQSLSLQSPLLASPSLQSSFLQPKAPINDDPQLEKEADEMGAKANRLVFAKDAFVNRSLVNRHQTGNRQLDHRRFIGHQLKRRQLIHRDSLSPVVQRVRTVIVGESHGVRKIRVRRKRTILSTNPGGAWIRQSEPSKLAAALIQHNNFTPPANYQAELARKMRINGALKTVMDTAERISNGNDLKWGAEDNLIGYGSSAQGRGTVAAQSTRTHIENPQIRADASFIRTLSGVGAHSLPKNIVESGFPNQSGYQVLKLISHRVVVAAETELGKASAPIRTKWASLKAVNGLLGKVVARSPSIAVTDETGASNVVVPRGNKSQWADQVIVQIEKGLQSLLETVVDEITKTLGAEFNRPLQTSPLSDKLIKDIAAAKYGSAASVLSRMHAIASIARTLTQLGGISSTNERYTAQNPNVANPRLGYVVGDSHLTDLVEIAKVHTDNDKLKSLIDSATIVRQSAYGNLRTAAINAVIATHRTPTLEVT